MIDAMNTTLGKVAMLAGLACLLLIGLCSFSFTTHNLPFENPPPMIAGTLVSSHAIALHAIALGRGQRDVVLKTIFFMTPHKVVAGHQNAADLGATDLGNRRC